MATLRSFAKQSLHYFVRPVDGRPSPPVAHPAVWRGEELVAQPGRWLVDLEPALVAELHRAATAAVASGVPLEDVDAGSFPLPSWTDRLAQWRERLTEGIGVVCLRGLPVREWGDEVTAAAYWGLGHHLGRPGAQNPDGELLGHVTDYGESSDHPMVRKYRTAADIAFHCDAADVVGLLCLRTAAQGGQSRLASSTAVFNEFARRRPDLVPELFAPFAIDRRDEEAPGERPWFDMVPCAWDGATLRTFWHSDYMRSAERHDGVEFTPARRDALDLYDEIAASPGFALDMELEEGDIQLVSNHAVIHARSAYVDHPDRVERRHLLRLWLSLDR